MDGKPSGPRSERWNCSGGGIIFMRDSRFTGLALLALMQLEHEVVGRVAERDQLQAGLQGKLRFALKRGDLALRERIALRRIEGLNERPLHACEIDSKPMTAPCVIRMGSRATQEVSIRGCAT